jgi:hypothetical protein
MNAIELKAIVNYLIESYCENVNGAFVYTIKDKDVQVVVEGVSSCLYVYIYYEYFIDNSEARITAESFTWDGTEKLTMLETYVNECLDRVYKAELIDNRGDDPAVG